MNNNKHIFYADDDLDDQELFREAVEEIGGSYDLHMRSDGRQLLNLLQSPPPAPDVIFLDLNMPLMNGYQALTEIRKNSKTRNVPVVIFSTSDDEKTINRSRELGANLYVPKPTSYKAIKNVLRHSLGIDWKTFDPAKENFVFRAC
ncbi:MAG: response regulator [Bacteroidetes bacterium]|nr:response regulator [Bacteroidota bacterium]